ncbi:serine/threonine-protein kinase polo-like [Anabrus simplex]|uniref:serine/threonine-protein kinase polo-like n=1 Tax=Anabrus simplex TaxID=316456 RepID=UPI0035A3C651
MASKEDSSHEEDDKHFIPVIIHDSGTGPLYKKGRFLGKGDFAKYYEVTEVETGNIYACKIISKKIISGNQKDTIVQGISIHRSLNHKHVVGFNSFFDDFHNIYIILELCRRRSLLELHKRRQALSEPEVRYYLTQILLGVDYLHKKNIIHRNLILENLFLNDELQVKIGGFGFAAGVEYQGKCEEYLWGTCNYIAPEVLMGKGHSFEVDVWAIGCILYILLFGKPPFEATTPEELHSRIKRCQYGLPCGTMVSNCAVKLIRDILQPEPKLRPKVEDILHSEFLSGYIPKQLPLSCLTMAPRFTAAGSGLSRNPFREINNIDYGGASSAASAVKKTAAPGISAVQEELLLNLDKLGNQLLTTLQTNPASKVRTTFGDEATDPAAQPVVWITKVMDYSSCKIGFGYQLSDKSVGVFFNDKTKLVLLADFENVHYYTDAGEESYHTMTEFPYALKKKMGLLTLFRNLFVKLKPSRTGGVASRESDSLSRIPCMFQWLDTSKAVLMHLNNGTLQVNFTDNTVIILCPHMGAVTYIDDKKNFQTYCFSTIRENGCSAALEERLKHALLYLTIMEIRYKVQ